MSELAIVHNCQGDECESHSQEVEEKGRNIAKSVFYQDEGRTPDEYHRQKQKVGQRRGAESMRQLFARSDRLLGGLIGISNVDSVPLDNSTKDLCAQELLR